MVVSWSSVKEKDDIVSEPFKIPLPFENVLDTFYESNLIKFVYLLNVNAYYVGTRIHKLSEQGQERDPRFSPNP